ncbi:MAG: hypothetical protein HQM01_14245 [Magnetococcales bacterium]|nr:hypothetical protein [Magnetococcales bacterium]
MTNASHPFRTTLVAALLLSGCATLDSPTISRAPDAPPVAATRSTDPDSGNAAPEAKSTAREIKGTVTPPPPKPTPPSHPSQVKPEGLIGSTGKELITRFGPPNLTLDLRLANRQAAEGYLYYPKDGKGCIHQFIVSAEKNKVIDYACR